MFPLSRDCLGPHWAFLYCLQLSQVQTVISLYSFYCAVCKCEAEYSRGRAFNTVCFINAGIASSDVNVFCISKKFRYETTSSAGCDRGVW